jgi:HTH-type transcriptional regulator / antitoxin HigA
MEIAISTRNIRPAINFGPGYFIKEQLELRDWTQDDLAHITGISPKHLNKILTEKQPLTLEHAKLFGEIFDTSPQYWLNLDTDYRLWLQAAKTQQEVDADIKSKIYARMPIKDMISKSWLPAIKSTSELVDAVLHFFSWKSLDQFDAFDQQLTPFAPRKSEAYNQFNTAYALTWFHKAKTVASTLEVKPYKKEELERLFERIHTYTRDPELIAEFVQDLSNAGVKFLVLPHLQKTYLDGAAFWQDANPVIVYTARHNRIDNFWFTLAHEIAHVLHHINKDTPYILDADLKDRQDDPMEKQANELAAQRLKHGEIHQHFYYFTGYKTTQVVEECAATYGVHPSIVVGKLAHDGHASYHQQNQYRDDVLKYIPKAQVFI